MIKIPIIMATNHLYLPYAAVSIASMIDTKNQDTFYDIYILHVESITFEAEEIIALSKNDVSISFRNIGNYIEAHKKQLYTRAHFTKEMYFRWWIAEVFPEFDKVLYLDCDTIVFCDLLSLYQTNLGTTVLGGVIDFATPKVCRRIEQQLALLAIQYINSGVLLFNLELWRSEHFMDDCIACLGRLGTLSCPDQDILNLVCRDRITYLPEKWNVQWQHLWDHSDDLLESPFRNMFFSAISAPNILHFTSSIKPWNCPPTPYSECFWHYASKLQFFKSRGTK